MKSRNIQKLLLFFTIGLFINACAVSDKFKQNYQEAVAIYPEPVNLDSAPQTTGLLLIDAVTKKALNTMSLSGVAIAKLKGGPGDEILIGSFKTGGILSQLSGVVVIPGLEPGKYKITKVKTQNANLWETLNIPPSDDFSIEVKEKSPVYFGQIQIKHPVGSTEREIKIIYDKKREIESWKMVSAKYKSSPWSTIINQHITSLE